MRLEGWSDTYRSWTGRPTLLSGCVHHYTMGTQAKQATPDYNKLELLS